MQENWNSDEIEEDFLEDFPPYDIDELTKEDILSDLVMNYLVNIINPSERIRQIEKVKDKARQFKVIKAFNELYKQKDNEVGIKNLQEKENMTIMFPELNGIEYNTRGQYEINKDGEIFQDIPKMGMLLICHHPILPIEKYKNLEDNSEKIKLAFYANKKWEYVIVDKITISSSQSIVKLSELGIAVTSENAKFIVKYLSEIENLNKDKIKTSVSVSRLGWAKDVLIPYSDKFDFDNERDFPHLEEKFGTSGNLEKWIEFFKERRKYNPISRIVMASAVASIILKRIKQNGFTLHIWGESEFGKTVACMVGQSIFGNPAQDGNGIGINFNFTNAGLEYRLNLYNNIPLFINEMQHQKDAKDYDKMLFLISEGTGKSRGTKSGGIGKENSWNNIVITNGEKNIIKDNSNAGAYNRCISCEITQYSYENLREVADFVKENYGNPIREILKHIDEYNCKEIYNKILESLDDQDITNKQKILEAIILLGDKLLTDIIFKDKYYLTKEDFVNNTIKKRQVAVEERAYELVKDWYISEKRHFLSEDGDDVDNQDLKVEIYGREMREGYLAIIPTVLKNTLQDNGYDFNEVLNAWKRKDYLKHEKNRNTLTVQINRTKVKCVVLNLRKDVLEEDSDEKNDDILPF